MRRLSILCAGALMALAATAGSASAQATNMSRHSGEARAYYGSDVPGFNSYAMQRRGHYAQRGRYVLPRAGWHAPYRHRYWRTEGIPPALYHAGDPQYWR